MQIQYFGKKTQKLALIALSKQENSDLRQLLRNFQNRMSMQQLITLLTSMKEEESLMQNMNHHLLSHVHSFIRQRIKESV